MTMVSKTRTMLEGLVREGSFKWLNRRRGVFDDEIEEMERSPSAGKNWLPDLSPPANVVVRRCSKLVCRSTYAVNFNYIWYLYVSFESICGYENGCFHLNW